MYFVVSGSVSYHCVVPSQVKNCARNTFRKVSETVSYPDDATAVSTSPLFWPPLSALTSRGGAGREPGFSRLVGERREASAARMARRCGDE